MLIDKEALKASGYRMVFQKDGEHFLFQKTVEEGDKKLYFITVELFLDSEAQLRAESEARFFRHAETKRNDGSSNQAFNVQLSVICNTTIEEMEAFYDRVYSRMYCFPDLYNN